MHARQSLGMNQTHCEHIPWLRVPTHRRSFGVCAAILHSKLRANSQPPFHPRLHSTHQTIPRSPQPLHTTDKTIPVTTHAYMRPLFISLTPDATWQSPLTTNVTTRAPCSTTATTAPWSSNPHRSLKGRGGDVGQDISRYNTRRECALRHLKGPMGRAGISLQFHVGMKACPRSGPESASEDHDSTLNLELRRMTRSASN